MKTFADQVNTFNKNLTFRGELPEGIEVMNPFEKQEILNITVDFYNKYYADNRERYLILGINPGRFGAGLTGIPFTDPKHLVNVCKISYPEKPVHEPSSVFIYDMIEAYGGIEKFYAKFYINSVSPLGFTQKQKNGKEINYNYYDSKDLVAATKGFIVESIQKQLEFGIKTDVCFCLGTGKNYKFLNRLNNEYNFFKKVIPLEHPRYIIQYKMKSKDQYITKYIMSLNSC